MDEAHALIHALTIDTTTRACAQLNMRKGIPRRKGREPPSRLETVFKALCSVLFHSTWLGRDEVFHERMRELVTGGKVTWSAVVQLLDLHSSRRWRWHRSLHRVKNAVHDKRMKELWMDSVRGSCDSCTHGQHTDADTHTERERESIHTHTPTAVGVLSHIY